MAITFIGSCDGQHQSSVTTSAMDSTGADTIIISVQTYNTTVPLTAISDSKSNVFVQLAHNNFGVYDQRIFLCRNPTVGGSHTFSFGTGGASYAVVSAAAFSGVGILSANDYTDATSASSVSAGPLTATSNGSLFYFSIGTGSTVTQSSVSGGFTEITDVAGVPSSWMGLHTSYKIQSTAASETPTSTLSGTDTMNATLLMFDPLPASSSSGSSSTPTAGTQVYPFRQWVEDDFGSGGGATFVIED